MDRSRSAARRPVRRPARRWPVVAAALVMFALGCSSDADPSPVEAEAASDTVPSTAEESDSDNTVDADSTSDPTDGTAGGETSDTDVDTGTDEQPDADQPVRRPAENPGNGDASHWIGHGLMSAEVIELGWSEVEGSEVVYRVYRTETGGGVDPAAVITDPANLVYEGSDRALTDTDVVRGVFYTYVLDVEVDGTTLRPNRWTQTLAADDTTPPTVITGLQAERTDDGVLLSWDRSSDDVEFGAYAVSLVVDGELRYVGGGADETQTSFLDTRPEPGELTYAVQAVDFHDNRSDPTTVQVSP